MAKNGEINNALLTMFKARRRLCKCIVNGTHGGRSHSGEPHPTPVRALISAACGKSGAWELSILTGRRGQGSGASVECSPVCANVRMYRVGRQVSTLVGSLTYLHVASRKCIRWCGGRYFVMEKSYSTSRYVVRTAPDAVWPRAFASAASRATMHTHIHKHTRTHHSPPNSPAPIDLRQQPPPGTGRRQARKVSGEWRGDHDGAVQNPHETTGMTRCP